MLPVKVSAFAADLTVVVPQLLHVLQRGHANLLIRQLLTLRGGRGQRRGGGAAWGIGENTRERDGESDPRGKC